MIAARIVAALACLVVATGTAAAQAPEAAPAQAPAAAPAPTPDPNAGPAYVGAAACKDCHKVIYDSWSQTKHSRTISRLSGGDKAGDCIRCHVTGSAEQIAKEGATPSHPNVQCEACHGPGSLHVADATVTRGLVKKPGAAACEKCHNDKSPRFRGFVYAAMVGFSHKK